MNLAIAAVWFLTIVIDTVGQLAFKAAASENTQHDGIAHWKAMAIRPWIWIGITSYIIEFFTWLIFLSLVRLSDGVMLGSINIVVILIAGRLFFNEKLTRNRLIGVILISLGVTVVGLGT